MNLWKGADCWISPRLLPLRLGAPRLLRRQLLMFRRLGRRPRSRFPLIGQFVVGSARSSAPRQIVVRFVPLAPWEILIRSVCHVASSSAATVAWGVPTTPTGHPPVPTATLIKRLRRIAKKIDREVKNTDDDPIVFDLPVAILRAAANTLLQAAGRLEDLAPPAGQETDR